jgi:RND family efflux transporter MFP subunit
MSAIPWLALVPVILLLTVSCARTEQNRNVHADAPVAIQAGEENIVRVKQGELVTGPLISGELRAAHAATVRAEVGGMIVHVPVEEGQRVQRGDLLGQIESHALVDARNSARSAVSSAEAALDLAHIEVGRNRDLVAAGAIAQRDLDQARTNLAAAQAQLANARASLVLAEEELDDATLRAPLTGIVSDRAVDRGDVVSAGTELFTIIDPATIRLEASVPSDQISDVRPGDAVRFTISGETETTGRIVRITPDADPTTRQVTIFVAIPARTDRLVIGLFADGRVITRSAAGLIVPSNAVNMEGERSWVLRIREGVAERVDVTVGLQDRLTETLLITAGVSEGDILLRGTDQAITPGTPVDVTNNTGAGFAR